MEVHTGSNPVLTAKKHKNMDAKEYLFVQIDAIKIMIELGKFNMQEAKDALTTAADVAMYMEENDVRLILNQQKENHE